MESFAKRKTSDFFNFFISHFTALMERRAVIELSMCAVQLALAVGLARMSPPLIDGENCETKDTTRPLIHYRLHNPKKTVQPQIECDTITPTKEKK